LEGTKDVIKEVTEKVTKVIPQIIKGITDKASYETLYVISSEIIEEREILARPRNSSTKRRVRWLLPITPSTSAWTNSRRRSRTSRPTSRTSRPIT